MWRYIVLRLINANCIHALDRLDPVNCIFADPPDGIGLKYNSYQDSDKHYHVLVEAWIKAFTQKSPIVWLSFNARWTPLFGRMCYALSNHPDWSVKPCVQTFTFGQHNRYDLGNNHRPLWRLKRWDAKLYPDSIRVPSWRQLNGDKRANSKGRVPGDVFDFPRVTGNSKQRRSYHPTQLHEGLVERCIKLSTAEGDTVLDPFAGTGTTLRVCKSINRDCTLIEMDKFYCEKILEEHPDLHFECEL